MIAHRKMLAVAIGLCAGPMIAVASGSLSMTMMLMAIGGIGLSIAIVTHPTIGLLVAAFMIPIERFGRITSDSSSFTISIMRIVGLLALGGFLLHVLLKKQQFRLGTAFWLYVAFVILACSSYVYSTDPESTAGTCGLMFSNVLFILVVIGICSSFRIVKIGTYAIYDWHFSSIYMKYEEDGLKETERFCTVAIDNSEWQTGMSEVIRSCGASSDFAANGINLILTVPFFFFYLRQQSKWYLRVVVWLSLLVVSYNVVITNTRAVLIFFVATLVLCVFRRVAVINLRLVAVVLLGILAMAPFVKADIFERILDPARYTVRGAASLQIRLVYWRVGLEAIQENWLLGTGMGNATEIPKRSKETWTPKKTGLHNVFLGTLLDLGVVGFSVFFSFVGLLIYHSFQAAHLFRLKKNEEAYWYMVSCQIAIIAVLLFGVQCDVFHFPLKGWWYVAGVTVVMHRIANQPMAVIS